MSFIETKTHLLIKLICVMSLIQIIGLGCVTSVARDSLNPPASALANMSVSAAADTDILAQAVPKPTIYTPKPTVEATKTIILIPPTTMAPTKPAPSKPPTATPMPSITPEQPPGIPEPVLDISGPLNNSSFTGDSVIIYGKSDPGTSITINDTESQIDDEGNFYAEVELITGINQFTIVSNSYDRDAISKTINVFKTAPQTLFISITKPLNQTVISASYVQISGLTSPDAKLKIDGVPVPITIERLDLANTVGLFDHVYQLSSGLNLINVSVTNTAGDSIDKLISVIHSN